jgi:hypothetical protein
LRRLLRLGHDDLRLGIAVRFGLLGTTGWSRKAQ